jgi:trehalose/maltose hydrolase-like predicted phosphorylase
VRWAAPDGNVTDLRYDVFTDRARQYVGVVRLQLTPEWSGAADVTDLFDGTDATLTTEVTRGWQPSQRRDWLTVATVGTGIQASLVSQLETGPGMPTSASSPVGGGPQTLGQRLVFPVHAGQTYSVTKSVGIAMEAARVEDVALPVTAIVGQARWRDALDRPPAMMTIAA